MEPNETRGQPGKPGKPGEAGTGRRGGTGGVGGEGGHGDVTGGAGGTGGVGGAGSPDGLPAASIRRSLWLVAGANAVMFMSLIVLAIYVFLVGARNHEALCSFKADLESRVATSNELLEEHEGDTIFGIPRAVIETSRDNLQRTVNSLEDLNC